jgi:hypothetical protein
VHPVATLSCTILMSCRIPADHWGSQFNNLQKSRNLVTFRGGGAWTTWLRKCSKCALPRDSSHPPLLDAGS